MRTLLLLAIVYPQLSFSQPIVMNVDYEVFGNEIEDHQISFIYSEEKRTLTMLDYSIDSTKVFNDVIAIGYSQDDHDNHKIRYGTNFLFGLSEEESLKYTVTISSNENDVLIVKLKYMDYEHIFITEKHKDFFVTLSDYFKF